MIIGSPPLKFNPISNERYTNGWFQYFSILGDALRGEWQRGKHNAQVITPNSTPDVRVSTLGSILVVDITWPAGDPVGNIIIKAPKCPLTYGHGWLGGILSLTSPKIDGNTITPPITGVQSTDYRVQIVSQILT